TGLRVYISSVTFNLLFLDNAYGCVSTSTGGIQIDAKAYLKAPSHGLSFDMNYIETHGDEVRM
ncbi:MAG: hypothetical protein WBQ66_10475, partial [Blastocatellia bacterium]